MFGRRDETDYMQDGSAREWWPRSHRARRRDRERAAAERMSDLRWRWRMACSATPLAPMIYTPSGVTKAAPIIDHIDLGPPIVLTVRMRLGQTIADFVDAAPKIAPAMEVAGIKVIPIAQQWVRVILLPAPVVALPDRSSESDREPVRFGA
jgi:hypothetical protein